MLQVARRVKAMDGESPEEFASQFLVLVKPTLKESDLPSLDFQTM